MTSPPGTRATPRPPPSVHLTRRPEWAPWRAELRRAAGDLADPAARAGALAGVVQATGATLSWAPPRWLRALQVEPSPVPPVPSALAGPELIGLAAEALVDPATRRSAGVHHTPPPVADAVVAFAVRGWRCPAGRTPTVYDPAAGGGAFLLAAARWLHHLGVSPAAAADALRGVDLDPLAVAAAEASLTCWAFVTKSAEPAPDALGGRLLVADGLGMVPGTPPVPEGGADLVVGNPPFLGQLGRATARDAARRRTLRRRFGDAVSAYTDEAALFLLAATASAAPGGRIALLQPTSVLAARDAAAVRARLLAQARLDGLWTEGGAAVFAGASVRVCALVLERSASAEAGRAEGERPDDPPGAAAADAADEAPPVRRAEGAPLADLPPVPAPPGDRPWSSLLTSVRGTPPVRLPAEPGQLGELAEVVAGFRPQYYGLVPAVRELGHDLPSDGHPLLVTSGSIDPVRCWWGERPVRFARRSWVRPVVDMAALEGEDPGLAGWVRARLRPKVVVATQTRVVEAAVDGTGGWVPSVPVISVEPLDPSPSARWRVAAVLLAPPVAAWALEESAGTARAPDAIKLSAAQVRRIPLPLDEASWAEAAERLATGASAEEFGRTALAAYGRRPDDPVLPWWRERLPSWR